MLQKPFRVVSAQSTRHADLRVTSPTQRAIARLEKLDSNVLAKQLGLSDAMKEFDLDSLRIVKRRLLIYRYESAKRVLLPERLPHEDKHAHEHLAVPLRAVPEEIENNHYYVAAEVIFVLGTRQIPDLRWIAIIEAETLSVLFLRPLVDTVDGLVFKDDPMTDNGGPLPSAGSASLNAVRTSVLLPGLLPPVAGNYALSGGIIQLLDVEPPPVIAPTSAVGTDFDFDARTDNFSAVNAYYHCERFFRLGQDLGFDLSTYFGGTLFPTTVDHRGMGITVNAHCLGNGTFGILRTTFALADTGNVVN